MNSKVISKKYLTSEYSNYLKKAKYFVAKNKFETALICASYCAYVASTYPFREEFCDDELESVLNDISLNLAICKGTTKIENRYVFYDSHFVDTAGLTQQYIRFELC